jgi:ABC-type phosphate transport system auxiliary subunit
MADDSANLTIEILKQIRDQMAAQRQELKAELGSLGGKVDSLRTEIQAQMLELRSVVMQHGRVVDGVLKASLDDYGRVAALERRVDALEAEARRDP